jgi:hypothetical protein
MRTPEDLKQLQTRRGLGDERDLWVLPCLRICFVNNRSTVFDELSASDLTVAIRGIDSRGMAVAK